MQLKIHSVIGLSAILFVACSSTPIIGPVDTTALEVEAIAAVERGDFASAQSIYAGLADRTRGTERSRFQVALANAEVELGRPESAIAVLDAIAPPIAPELEPAVAAVRAAAYFSVGRTADAVGLLLDREIWLETGAEILDNQSRIWDGLSEPLSQTAAVLRTGDATIDGWLALAPLTRLTGDEARFLDALIVWRDEFGNHPAAGGILAERLAALRGDGVRPTRIALLLPLSSAVRASAEAILEGFIAAHLEGGFADQTSIRVYDTTQRGSVESFLTAQLEGADFIVGPLISSEVADVQTQAGFVPTLALNVGDPNFVAATNFFQFALTSDDEIEAIAARAIADGHRTAAVLYSSSDRGYSQRDRFQDAFESRGGQVIKAVPYVRESQNLANAIEELLNISQSESRFERLQANLGRSIEFEARRREDIDMIFLQLEPVGGDVDARLLVPLFRDNHADPVEVPTFATRDVYDPSRPSGASDLNGLMFPDVPLLIDPEGPARTAADLLGTYASAAANQAKRFFAFGFDAYQLANALYSRGDASWPIDGATGQLYLDDNGRIRRVVPFAEFRGGQPRPLGPPAASARMR